MTREEWYNLKSGDIVRHINGDVERVVEYNGECFIDAKKSLYPLSEFDWNDFTKINRSVGLKAHK